MKQKYLASICILSTFASCALAYDLVADPAHTAWQASQDSRLQILDARLADKVNELLVLGELLSQHMDQAQNIASYDRSNSLLVGQGAAVLAPSSVTTTEPVVSSLTAAPALRGAITQPTRTEHSLRETAAQALPQKASQYRAAALGAQPAIGTLVQTEPSAFRIRRAQAPGAAPAWEEYRLSMVVVSEAIHLAVINNQYVRRGDQLIPGVTVTDISAKQVVLSRNDQTIQLTMADE